MNHKSVVEMPTASCVREIAARYKLGKATVDRAISRGDLVAKKIGSRTIILLEDELKWISGLPRAGQRAAA